LIREDRVLFAGDTMMPVPYFVDGSYDDFVSSLHALRKGGFENIVQGHGEVVLRGEAEEIIQGNLDYLAAVRQHVEAALEAGEPIEALDKVSIELCGKSRIPLNGLVQDLHQANLRALYQALQLQRAVR